MANYFNKKGDLEIMKELDEKYPNTICIIEVNENLRRVRLGQELTRPLKQLNKNCHFKEKYKEIFDIENEERIKQEKQRNKIRKAT